MMEVDKSTQNKLQNILIKLHGLNVTTIFTRAYWQEARKKKKLNLKRNYFFKFIWRIETNGILDGKEQQTAILYQELHSLLQYFQP